MGSGRNNNEPANATHAKLDVYDDLLSLRDTCRQHGMDLSSLLIGAAAESILDAMKSKNICDRVIDQNDAEEGVIFLQNYRR